MRIERFAPSPTGLLHLGHAYSAAMCWLGANRHNGSFRLRLEDLDHSRCKPEFYDAVEEDLRWLGLHWDGKILRQSTRLTAYASALARLECEGLLYPCVCTRRDLRDAVNAPQEGAGRLVDGILYPGTCRDRAIEWDAACALRLNMAAAIEYLGGYSAVSRLGFENTDATQTKSHILLSGEQLMRSAGDVVLRRKDGVPAYHLSVIVDDAHQNITHVTRGEDLLESTAIHRLLQALLELPVPGYHHHRLIRDEAGKRLAKRDDARSIRSLREAGASRADIFRHLGLSDLAAESAV